MICIACTAVGRGALHIITFYSHNILWGCKEPPLLTEKIRPREIKYIFQDKTGSECPIKIKPRWFNTQVGTKGA